MPMVLVATVPDGQCTTNGVGSYVEGEITISSMGLVLTVPDAQCTTNGVGSYVGIGITKSSIGLALTVPDDQCTTNGVGSYVGKGITISSMVLVLTLAGRLQFCQWSWLIRCRMTNVPPMGLALTLMGGMLTTSFFRKD